MKNKPDEWEDEKVIDCFIESLHERVHGCI